MWAEPTTDLFLRLKLAGFEPPSAYGHNRGPARRCVRAPVSAAIPLASCDYSVSTIWRCGTVLSLPRTKDLALAVSRRYAEVGLAAPHSGPLTTHTHHGHPQRQSSPSSRRDYFVGQGVAGRPGRAARTTTGHYLQPARPRFNDSGSDVPTLTSRRGGADIDTSRMVVAHASPRHQRTAAARPRLDWCPGKADRPR